MKKDKEIYIPTQEDKETIEGHKVLMGQFWENNREKFETQAQVNVLYENISEQFRLQNPNVPMPRGFEQEAKK